MWFSFLITNGWQVHLTPKLVCFVYASVVVKYLLNFVEQVQRNYIQKGQFDSSCKLKLVLSYDIYIYIDRERGGERHLVYAIYISRKH